MYDSIDLDSLERSVAEARAMGGDRAALSPIARSWPSVSTADGARLRELIESIPHGEWADDPWIIAAMGASYRSLGSGSRSAALPWFHTAQALLAADQDAAVSTSAGINLHHSAALRSMGKLDSARRRADLARAMLDTDVTLSPSLRVRMQAKVALQLGLLAIHRGDYAPALADLRLAYGLEEHLTRSELVEALAGVSFQRYTVGEFDTALHYASLARAASGTSGYLSSRFGALALITELMVAVEQNRLADALALHPQVTAASIHTDWEALGHYAIGTTAVISGHYIEGLDQLHRAIEAVQDWEGPPLVRIMATGMRGVLFMHLGETQEALAIFEKLEPTTNHANCPARFVAGIRFAAGDYQGTLDALAECAALGDDHSNRTLIDVLMLRAAANYELGNTVIADVAFDRALHFASQSGMRTPFLLVPGPVMQRMLGRAADRNQPDAVHDILDEMRGGHGGPLHGTIEPLSDRERDIVQQLYLDKTINQIAAELFISSNTVKTHVRSIYRKLEASNRKEAMRRVKELGLHLEITPF